jgi:hypothetical protein
MSFRLPKFVQASPTITSIQYSNDFLLKNLHHKYPNRKDLFKLIIDSIIISLFFKRVLMPKMIYIILLYS